MRLPRLTCSTRGLLILTLLLGLPAGGVKLWMRRMAFLELAEAHASRVYDYGENREAGCWRDEFLLDDPKDGTRLKKAFAEHLDVARDHFAELERKYRYAASHPWLAVEPDPPSSPINLRLFPIHDALNSSELAQSRTESGGRHR
jgi:hypothetical protein